MLGFVRVVFSVFFSFSVFRVLLMTYVFFPSSEKSEIKVFLSLDEKKEHAMITD